MANSLLQDLPDLSKDALVELSGWTIFRGGRDLFRSGAVKSWRWEKPWLSGCVEAGGKVLTLRVNLKSLVFAETRCPCPTGRRGQFCEHAVALCMAAQKASEERISELAAGKGGTKPTASPAPQAEAADLPPQLKYLRYSSSAAQGLRLRLLLPPNFKEALQRGSVMIKLELQVDNERVSPEKVFRGVPYRIPVLQQLALAHIETWCGGQLASLIQLKQAQLRLLTGILGEEACFFAVRAPDTVVDTGDITAELPEEKPVAADAPDPAQVRVPKRGASPTARQRPSAVELYKQRTSREAKTLDGVEVDGSPHFLSLRLPSKDHPLYRRGVDFLKAEGFRSEPSNGRWWLRNQHKVLNFLARYRGELDSVYRAQYSANFETRMAAVQMLDLRCEAQAMGDQFRVVLELTAKDVSESDVRSAIASGRNYVIQQDAIYLINPDKLQRLTEGIEALSGQHGLAWSGRFETKVKTAQLSDAERILEDLDSDVALPVDWKSRSAALSNVGKLEAPPLPARFDELLRSYQRIGVAWLWHLYRNQLGGVLADEMGLGKTVQAIGLMHCIFSRRESHEGPAIVVAPASLLRNWEREIQRFAPGLRVFVHHRESRISDEDAITDYEVLITSYATLIRDQDLFRHQEFALIVADEAQHIKNRQSQSARALRGLHGTGRFVLTGTPIENTLDDLRSIFEFVLPGYLARRPHGLKGDDREWYDRRHLEQAAPYILRRNKQTVAPDLPDKIEQVIYCDIDPLQRKLYDRVQEVSARKMQDMASAGQSENQMRFAALTELLRLRQVCADPGMLEPNFPLESSAKLQAFEEILYEALDGNHRMLVFSQFVQLLKRLKGWLEERGIPVLYLDGSTRNRLELCDQFNNDATIPVFLISLKAGGTGLNLTGADTVVHFDPWWNPAVEDQATDRAHRIGQNRVVTSYKLITSGTVEEKVQILQEKKSALLRDLLDESIASTAKVSMEDLKELIGSK
ncbi:MAG: DEAD/DEAH box helicase [Opitutales bacterium]|nr:DEAD/DEAH box helicase [Opitutales bacterium]